MTNCGLDILKGFEGCRLTAYTCPAGKLTIGYGHTGSDVTSRKTVTQDFADNLLKQDLVKFERGVKRLVTVPLNENQLAALVVLSYNIGLGNLEHSTLLKLVNEGKHEQAANEFQKWNLCNGKVLPGLVARRKAESELYVKAV
jgi:lysozyme